MRISVFNTLALGMVMALAAGTASATTLSTTSQAMPGWQGSVNYTATGAIGQTLNATIQYAVFLTGAEFQNFLNENGIVYADAAIGSEYVYAYQIVAITGTNPGISTFTVGLNGNAAPEVLGATGVKYIPLVTNHGTYSPLPANNPTLVGGGPGVVIAPGQLATSSQWMYFGSLTNGEASGILYYSNPKQPELGLSVVASGTASRSLANSLPNPVPEPTSVMLLACSALLVAGSRARWALR